MTYAFPFTTLTLNGTLAGGNEIWSAGLHLDILGTDYGTWSAGMATVINEIRDACEELISDAAILVPADVALTSVKLSYRDTAGHYLGPALEAEATANGIQNTGYLPQGALVTTFVSPIWKDPGRYNRFYLPINPGQLGSTWKLDSNQQGAYAARMATFVGELNDILESIPGGTSGGVVVVSGSGTGSTAPVTSVRVGAIVDTQRRRRNALPESYVTEPIIFI